MFGERSYARGQHHLYVIYVKEPQFPLKVENEVHTLHANEWYLSCQYQQKR
jgi:hypothetical protein